MSAGTCPGRLPRDARRLAGRTIATTRGGDPRDPLARRLEAEGARVVVWPTLAFAPAADPAALAAALGRLEEFDWIAFTSARAVEAVGGPPTGGTPRVACVGAATARAAAEAGWGEAGVVAGSGGAKALAALLADGARLDGARILFPAASRARPTLERALGAVGARVVRVEAYHTLLAPPEGERVRSDLAAGVDVATFASPSAVEALAAALDGDLAAGLARASGVAAIGRTTAAALTAAGVGRVVVAPSPSVDGLVEACVAIAAAEGTG